MIVLYQFVMVIDLNQWEELHMLSPSTYKDTTENLVSWKTETTIFRAKLKWKKFDIDTLSLSVVKDFPIDLWGDKFLQVPK